MLLNNERRRKGFSLVELLVVMVIIAMLAGLAAQGVKGYLVSAKKRAAVIEIAIICKAIDSFYADQGRYPTTSEGIAILTQPTDNFPTGYLNKMPKDPWKRSYIYRSPGRKGGYDIISYGEDGKEGGIRESADIYNETSG
jgi:general secretion pathway protein G